MAGGHNTNLVNLLPILIISDHDDMPDEWEIADDLDPHNPNDTFKDRNEKGYTNIKYHLNCMASGKDSKKSLRL